AATPRRAVRHYSWGLLSRHMPLAANSPAHTTSPDSILDIHCPFIVRQCHWAHKRYWHTMIVVWGQAREYRPQGRMPSRPGLVQTKTGTPVYQHIDKWNRAVIPFFHLTIRLSSVAVDSLPLFRKHCMLPEISQRLTVQLQRYNICYTRGRA